MTIQETISQQALLLSIWQLVGGYPDPGKSNPPGPWDTLIRRALQRSFLAFGPHTDAWRGQWGSGPGPDPWIQAELNPQPLPPRAMVYAALAQEIAERALVMQETADAIMGQGEEHGIIVVGGYISKFVEDLCGNGFRMPWPFPPPRPWWLPEEVSGLDLVVAGVQFQKTASGTFNCQLKQVFAEAGARLLQAGLSRLQ
ncbi:MAG: hypothetical protein L0Y50_09605 [Beijerinckiaceae bacterium]|nr:hypothetical protein [Beijerinckiaceae bacterium]